MGETEGAQQYCLRWNNHSESILSAFELLLGQEDFIDVTLSCEKKTLKAHKVVLSACSTYFRKLLKENPCQHPIIILRDVGYSELAALVHFMYHGQVMVEQDKIPQLLQTAQLLEVRGLSEVSELESVANDDGDSSTGLKPSKGSQSFLAGLLGTSVSATKRPATASSSSTVPTSSPTPPPLKKTRPCPRPVPMLQSILSQQLSSPATPTFDLSKSMGSSTRALSSLVSKAKTTNNSTQAPGATTVSFSPSLENLLNLGSLAAATDNPSQSSTTSSEDIADKESKMDSCGSEMENSAQGGGLEFEPDTVVQVKEEPLMNFDDDFGDDSRGGITGDEGDDQSEFEEGAISDNSRSDSGLLPLLAQHLAAPSMLSASAKLRAAASQARGTSAAGSGSLDTPFIAQILLSQSSDSLSSPSAGGNAGSDASGSDPPRKLAFHEPRPCPICRRMYRDAATLRTHTAIMHAEGRDPFACMCGELFRTKYEMYTHKKNGHR